MTAVGGIGRCFKMANCAGSAILLLITKFAAPFLRTVEREERVEGRTEHQPLSEGKRR